MAIKPVEILIKARDEASGIFGTLQGKVAAVGVAIAGYFGISAFIGAVKGASELEAKLSEVKAVSGATVAEMVLLRKAAEDAGATTKFTATEGADALGNLARAGLSAKDAIAALPAVLQLAQAGDIGLAEASEYVTKTVTGMGLAFSDAGRVADVLAMGANASNTSVTGLAQALSYSAPVAKSLGLSLEFTVAMIGKFADGGIDASRAGTALNAVMSQFSDPASKFRQELAAAGITTGSFEKALRQLAAAGPAGEKAILAVGLEAGPAFRALMNQGIGALDDLKGKLDSAKGSAAATAAVMEDNLKGSFNSLSSAWDTVKNALATPVLPVLRDGVTELSTALSSAVSNGTIGRFGDAIATAFQGGLKWAQEFLGTVNFSEVTTRMQAFATRTQEVFAQISEYATNAGNIVKTAYGVMSAGTNAVLTAVYGLGVAFSGVVAGIQNGLALLYEGMAKITFGNISAQYKQLAAEIRLSAEATSASSYALATKAIESFTAMGNSAQLAREGWAGLTNGAKDAQTQANASAQAFKAVAETLKEVGGDATATGQKAQAAGILQREAADATRAAVAQLKTEYEAALAAGNVQLAVDKLQAMQGALKVTGEEAKKLAAEKLKEVADAFTSLGITSQASLKTAAESARGFYETIKASANSTAIDSANAFKVYAEKAIAANGGVATEALKVKAAMEGVSIQTDSTGKTIVKSMGEAAKSVGDVGHQFQQTTEQIKKQEEAMDRLMMKYTLSANYTERQLALLEKENALLERRNALEDKRLNRDKEGYSLNTAGQRVAMQGESERSVYESAKSQGLSEAQALQIAKQFFQNGQQVGGPDMFSAKQGATWFTEVQKAIDKAVMDNAAKTATTGKPDSTPSQNQPFAPGQSPTNTVNVRITLPNGAVQTVPTTQDGSVALIAALQGAKLSAGI